MFSSGKLERYVPTFYGWGRRIKNIVIGENRPLTERNCPWSNFDQQTLFEAKNNPSMKVSKPGVGKADGKGDQIKVDLKREVGKKIEEWAIKLICLEFTDEEVLIAVSNWLKTPIGMLYEKNDIKEMQKEEWYSQRDDLVDPHYQYDVNRACVFGRLCAAVEVRSWKLREEKQEIKEAAERHPIEIKDFEGYAKYLNKWLDAMMGYKIEKQDLIDAKAFIIWQRTTEGKEMKTKWEGLYKEEREKIMEKVLFSED
jgi:hypothetical protein